jgi:surfeit locus 1 family protein
MKRYALLALAVLATIGFCALGFWQVERLEWKLALIDRVERRVHAEPVAPPAPAAWATVSRENAEYLRVTATGRFLPGKETLVNAVTALGGGFWVMAPFQTDAGFVVLVNRGFVPSKAQSSARPDTLPRVAVPHGDGSAPSRVTGLLRMSEPGGGFLRANAPSENRWYSRDVEAISQAQQLPAVAPYFIDAEASGGEGPVGGLTVVKFRNSHLMYAITWFSLALLTAVFGTFVARRR